MCPLAIINPRLEIEKEYLNINRPHQGMLTERVVSKWIDVSHPLVQTNSSCFARHVVARLSTVLAIVAFSVSRVADLIIGILALPVAFITGGTCERINTLVFQGFFILTLPSDIIACLSFLINPQRLLPPSERT